MLKKYISLLRAVNVGGKNLLPMKDLKKELINAGFQNVQTYLQSGNLILEDQRSSHAVNQEIQDLIKDKFELEISVLTYTDHDFKEIFNAHPFIDGSFDTRKIYFSFLLTNPNQNLLDEFLNKTFLGEKFIFRNGVLYCYYENGYGKSKMNGSSIEKKLKATCTVRNYNTAQKLAS